MKLYEFTAKGIYLGAVIVVLAKRKDEAMKLAKQWAKDNGVDPNTVEFFCQTPVDAPGVVYGWNGDY
jgi:hypothetical protein